MAKIKVENSPLLKEGNYDVKEVKELNYFSITGEDKKGRQLTKGTSSKLYHIELHQEKNGSKSQLYTMYGPTGKVQKKEYRNFPDEFSAKKEFDRIVKSKLRKGYVEVDVAQRVLGTEEAKKIKKPVNLKNAPKVVDNTDPLHPETRRIVNVLMGSTNSWVLKTLKCPLGQLTNNQIDLGRDCLNEAKQILGSGKNKNKIQELTNRFYSLIPHNLGSGARGQMTHLLLDTKEKIDQKEYDLDTLLDAKAIGAVLASDSVYDQYKSLETEFNYIDHQDRLFTWLNAMIQETRAHNHSSLGKITLLNAWDIQRNGEKGTFLKRANKIAGECGKQVFPDKMEKLVRNRPDGNDRLFQKANVIPLFHGTRTQNVTGILKKGILIRPSGVVICGAMYGHGIYFSSHGSKSIQYSSVKTSYWARGQDDKAFLFLSDCALGNQKIAHGAYPYTLNNIKPSHSVWAKGGYSGVINDEMMLYRTDQHNLRYLLEFTCQKN